MWDRRTMPYASESFAVEMQFQMHPSEALMRLVSSYRVLMKQRGREGALRKHKEVQSCLVLFTRYPRGIIP